MCSSKHQPENVLGSESVRVEQTTQTYFKLVVSAPIAWIFVKFEHFSKIYRDNSNIIKIWEVWRIVYVKTHVNIC